MFIKNKFQLCKYNTFRLLFICHTLQIQLSLFYKKVQNCLTVFYSVRISVIFIFIAKLIIWEYNLYVIVCVGSLLHFSFRFASTATFYSKNRVHHYYEVLLLDRFHYNIICFTSITMSYLLEIFFMFSKNTFRERKLFKKILTRRNWVLLQKQKRNT